MKANVKPIPDGFHTITVSLTLKSSRAAIEFYKKAFDAQVVEIVSRPDGSGTMHTLIKVGDSFLMMGDEMEHCKSAETLGGSPISLYVYVPNVDTVFNQAVGAGAKVTMPVGDMFWGDRSGSVKDPFGYTWVLATHNRDLSKEEIEEGAKEFCEQMVQKAS